MAKARSLSVHKTNFTHIQNKCVKLQMKLTVTCVKSFTHGLPTRGSVHERRLRLCSQNSHHPRSTISGIDVHCLQLSAAAWQRHTVHILHMTSALVVHLNSISRPPDTLSADLCFTTDSFFFFFLFWPHNLRAG